MVRGLVTRFATSLFRSDDEGYTEAQVFLGAGIPSGVTPGYTGTPGYNASSPTDRVGAVTTPWVFQTAADFVAAGATGGGTQANPYVLNNYHLYAFTSANSDSQAAFTWSDNGTSGDYWVKLRNFQFGVGDFNANKAGDIMCSAPSGGGLIISACTFDGHLALDNGHNNVGHINVATGTFVMNASKLVRSQVGVWVYKSGANAAVIVRDCLADQSSGAWTSGQFVFRNGVAGGSFNIERYTQDTRNATFLYGAEKNCQVIIDRVVFNSTDNSGCQYAIPLHTTYVTEAWTSGLTMTNSKFYMGSTPFIGWNDTTQNQTIKNWDIRNCEFLSTRDAGAGGAFMVSLGDGDAGATGTCDNVNIRWCRFTRPPTVNISAGNEVMYISKSSYCTIECNWVNECGEDAYELHTPYLGNIIRYCGGGHVSTSTTTDSYVNGNIVDIYGAGSTWTNSQVLIHDIWGRCNGDGVIVDSCHNVTVRNIDIDNHIGGFLQNPPASMIRLHWRSESTTPSLNGVTVGGTFAVTTSCFNGKTCELTYENATASAYANSTPGTVAWVQVSAGVLVSKTGAQGIRDAM